MATENTRATNVTCSDLWSRALAMPRRDADVVGSDPSDGVNFNCERIVMAHGRINVNIYSVEFREWF